MNQRTPVKIIDTEEEVNHLKIMMLIMQIRNMVDIKKNPETHQFVKIIVIKE